MAQLKRFPEDCRALLIEPEPFQALTLELLFQEFGCRRMGPAGSYREVEELLSRRRPSFALVDADLGQQLQPFSDLLDEHDVPFAFVAIGAESQVLDRHPMLNNRPRIHRPYHGPTLHAASRRLYGDNVARGIARVDRHLAEGKALLARQIALIERLAAAGADTSTADALARKYGRALKAMRAGRDLLAQRLESISEHATQATRVAVHEPFT